MVKICHNPPIDVSARYTSSNRYSLLNDIVDFYHFWLRQVPELTLVPPETGGISGTGQQVSIRRVQGMRAVGVNPIDENDVAPDDKDEFDDLPTMGNIPADKDIEEGDEEKDDDSDFPPAMPPAV